MSVSQCFSVPGQVESLQSWTEQSTVGRECFCPQVSPAQVELSELPAASQDPGDQTTLVVSHGQPCQAQLTCSVRSW